ncbi:MFS transporter [Kutzneria viridogrisea]
MTINRVNRPAAMVHPAQRRVLSVLVCTQVFGAAGVGLGVAVAVLVTTSLSESTVVGGLGATATALGAAGLALVVATLSTRYGRRRALLVAYATGAFGGAVAALAVQLRSWPLLLAALVPFGGGTSATLAARFAATDLAAPAHRASTLSTVVWSTTLGAVAGPNLVEPATRFAGDGGPFLLAAAVFALAAAGIALGLRADPLMPVGTVPAAIGDSCCGVTGSAIPAEPVRWSMLRVLSPSARLALLGVTLCNTAMVGMMSMTPVQMQHTGSSLTVVGVVISLHVAAMYAGSPLFGWLADRLGRMPVLAVGAALVVAAAGVCGMADSHEAPQLAVGMAVLGAGWSAGVVAGSALLTESVPAPLRQAAQGLSDLLMNAGGALGGLAAGVVVQAWSYPALGLLLGFLALPVLMASVLTTLRPAR